MVTIGRSALALLALLTPAAVAAPAQAVTRVVVDGSDSRARVDLLRVKLRNADDRLLVRLRFDDLVRRSDKAGQSVGIYFDTDGSRPGPEIGLGSGLNYGTDYQLVRMRNWSQSTSRVSCVYDAELDWAADTATYVLEPACFGDYSRVRVAVEASEYDGDVITSDWLREIKAFSPWVRRR